jgi:hypothetical protein
VDKNVLFQGRQRISSDEKIRHKVRQGIDPEYIYHSRPGGSEETTPNPVLADLSGLVAFM